VEEALASAVQGDVAPLDRLMTALRTPYDHANVPPEFASPAPESDGPYRTFCGT
jgi:serine/tyrosine/threonine adenylyltransferase